MLQCVYTWHVTSCLSHVTVTATGVCLLQSQQQVCARRGCVTMMGGVYESRHCVCNVFMCV